MSSPSEDEEKRESEYEAMKAKVMDALKKTFRPEFINRLDGIMVFRSLTRDQEGVRRHQRQRWRGRSRRSRRRSRRSGSARRSPRPARARGSGQSLLRGYQLCVKHMNDKGGVLGRKLELLVYDDGSDPATAVRLYEKLITQDKVDLVLGPYTSPITDAVADVTEKHKMPMVAPSAGLTSIYRKGRKFIFSLISPTEIFLEGLIDLAAKKGLKTVALINATMSAGRAMRQGAIELAKKKGLQVVFADAYPLGTTDFSAILTKVRAANPDVLGVATSAFEDGGGHHSPDEGAGRESPDGRDARRRCTCPSLYEVLGRDAEFVYGAATWVPELVEIRAGGLIPIARQYPGAREFVESSKKEFPGADFLPLPGTAPVRFSSRPSGAPGRWTARRSATPFQRWTTTPSSAGSGSIGMGSRSGTRCCWSSGRTARGRSSGPRSWRRTSRASRRRRGASARERRREGLRRRPPRGAGVGGRAGRGGAAADPDRRDALPDRRVRGGRPEPAPRLPALRQAPERQGRGAGAEARAGRLRRRVGPRHGRPSL